MRAATLLGLMLPVMGALACGPLLQADPMGSVEGGGTVRLLAEHPSVSLNHERLIFEPQTDCTRLTASLEMENHAPAAEVPMVFPIPLWHPGSGQNFVRNFAVSVDGVALVATEGAGRPLALSAGNVSCRWYHFTVPFGTRQKRNLTVTYEVSGGGQVSYLLATGGTWKDTIRSFELEVKLGERLNFNHLVLTSEEQPLAYEQRENSLFWRMAEYNGKPEVIWFKAQSGPATVLLDGVKAWPLFRYGKQAGAVSLAELYHLPVRWYEGKLLTSASVLRDLLMVRVRYPETTEGGWQTLSVWRLDGTCQTRGIKLPPPTPGSNASAEWYVEAAPVVAAFGGGVSHTVNAAGDVEISLTSMPDSVSAARKLALKMISDSPFRLRCLNYLKQHDPAALSEVARQIGNATSEDIIVLMALVGHLADEPQPALTASRALALQSPWAPRDRYETIIGLGLYLNDEAFIRGTGLTLRQLNATEARKQVLDTLLSPRGGLAANAGLILLALGQPDSAQKLIEALQPLQDRVKLMNGCIALGYLGDDTAIPYLQGVIRNHLPVNDGVNDAAAEALALMGTRKALETCTAMLPLRSESKWVPRHLFTGLERAVGLEPPQGYYYPTRPVWARSLSEAESKRVVLAQATALQPILGERYQPGLEAIIAACAP